jgi:hypothetical protein
MYGKIINSALMVSEFQRDGYKPIIYAELPENFDQTTQYAIQSLPIENDDCVYMGINIIDLPVENVNEVLAAE